MIGEGLPVLTFGPMPVYFPRLTQLASGTSIARKTTFVVHENLHPAAPLRFGAGKISRMWPEAKSAG